jgi:hypothetical protein
MLGSVIIIVVKSIDDVISLISTVVIGVGFWYSIAQRGRFINTCQSIMLNGCDVNSDVFAVLHIDSTISILSTYYMC